MKWTSIFKLLFTRIEIPTWQSSYSDENDEDVYAYQFSAILDDKTCDLCLILDGKIIDPDDDAFEIFKPPLHAECRCIWVAILEDEFEKPAITGLPQELVNHTDSQKKIPQSLVRKLASTNSYSEARGEHTA